MFIRSQVKYQSKLKINKARRHYINVSFFWYLVSLGFIAFLVDVDTREITIQIMGLIVNQVSWAEGIVYVQRFYMWSIIFHILVQYPIEYGFKNFYRKSLDADVKYNELLIGFKRGYSKVMATLLIRDIITFAASLFLLIPGLVCCYAYRFVPYLMEEYPEKTTMELLKLSSLMTKGVKLKLFMLDCSFIGWKIAGYLTGGLTNLYFTSYQGLTDAAIYEIVKNQGVMENDY